MINGPSGTCPVQLAPSENRIIRNYLIIAEFSILGTIIVTERLFFAFKE